MKPELLKVATIFATLLLLLYSVVSSLDRIDKYLRSKAIDECAKISKYERISSEEGYKVSYPQEEVFQKCIQLKGY